MRNACKNISALLGCAMLVLGASRLIARDGTSTSPSTPPTKPLKLNPSSLSLSSAANQLAAMRAEDPIKFFAMDLSDLTSLLDAFNTRDPLQPRQEQFVTRLDELIALIEKQQKGGGGGGGRPMNDSVIAKGPGGQGPMHDAQSGTKQWGQLPPKQREQILQSQNEGFPAGFESILSSYYKRLAQEQVGADSSAPSSSDSPTTQPATQPEAR